MSKNAVFKKYVSAYAGGDGVRWKASFPDGRGDKIRKQGFLTQALALDWVSKEYERIRIGYVESDQTFCEFAESFLLHEKEAKPSTRGSYEDILRLYIKPFFRDISMPELNVQVASTFLKNLNLNKSISGTHKRKIFSIFKLVYRETLTSGFALDYRVMTLKLPKKDTEEAICWSTDELLRFVNDPEIQKDHQYYLWMAAGTIGGRAGELMALEWGDLDLGSDYPSIRFSKRRCQKSGLEFSGTKNGDKRTCYLTPDATELMKEFKAKSGAVFPKMKVFDQSWDQKHFARDLKAACRKVGVTEITFHQLRHSFITWLASRGVDGKLISMLAGHRDERVTEIYIHKNQEMQKLYWERNKTKLESIRQNSGNFAVSDSDSVMIKKI